MFFSFNSRVFNFEVEIYTSFKRVKFELNFFFQELMLSMDFFSLFGFVFVYFVIYLFGV